MPPRGVTSRKRARQYEHIKESEQQQGRSTKRAKQIAAATVNKQRSEAGETKGSRNGKGSRQGSSRKPAGTSRKTSSGSRKTSRKTIRKSTRKATGRKKR